MAHTFAFGDLVVGAGQGEEPSDDAPVGIIAELRRTDCRVFHPRTGNSLWVALPDLRRIGPDRAKGTIEELITNLLRLLRANSFEYTQPEPGLHRLIASHGGFGPERVDEVRSALATRLRRYIIRPEGMRRIQTILEFVD